MIGAILFLFAALLFVSLFVYGWCLIVQDTIRNWHTRFPKTKREDA